MNCYGELNHILSAERMDKTVRKDRKRMNWIEIIVHTTTDGADYISGMLMDRGIAGTMIVDRADIPDPGRPHGYWEIVDPKLLDSMPPDVEVHAWLEDVPSSLSVLSDLSSNLFQLKSSRPDYGTLDMDSRSVSDETWTDVWKKYYKPFYAADHLVIKPTWEEFSPLPGDRVIEIDPGMAFGSGTHETTAMCISMLEKVIRGGEEVIDVGTGSGILSIAAGLLGAGHVLAVDIDPDAVRVAAENVSHNGLENVVDVQQGNLLDHIEQVCDICVANIISDVIISFAKPLMNHIVPGGLFLCSGIVKDRSGEVRNALEDAGYEILKTEYRGEWTAFMSRRNN